MVLSRGSLLNTRPRITSGSLELSTNTTHYRARIRI
uniref:ORF35 n=1 Tax=Thermostichus vulcanus TaxID=32053 RepID=Q56168_THEVL|nr:hypothetical protein 35 (psaA 5' region) - Synechococcus sp [Synechococcus sp.]BAA01758.1 ORF35 [Thermostichus vulcanus]